ncbi:hypothetical protein F4823DRAFT_126725 [Ustulina deusta]|nr:hypothetical protein F4823DRAFT_126725 [Ustulina deusta]
MDAKQDIPAKTASIVGPPPTASQSGNNTARAEIAVPPSWAADDEALTTALTRLVNRVYSEAERGIYSTDFERTSAEDIADLLRAGELAVAYLPRRGANGSAANSNTDDIGGPKPAFHETHGTPIGCISMKQVSPTAGEFGMLAVDPPRRGGGVGRDLVVFAEERCRQHLGLRAMRLELLAPVHFEHAGKTRLQDWYERLGYVRVELRDFEQAYPRLFELLSGPTEFRVFEKKFVD